MDATESQSRARDSHEMGAIRSPEKIAREFASGDPAATAAIRNRVRKILSFRGYGIPPVEREDLEQEVMSQLWQKVERRASTRDREFWGLVETVAARRSIDWLRSRRRNRMLPVDLVDERPGPLAQLLGKERLELVSAALAGLGEPCRRLIYWHAELQLPYREIARLTGQQEGALRVRMYRCVRQVRQILADLTAPTQRALETDDRS